MAEFVRFQLVHAQVLGGIEIAVYVQRLIDCKQDWLSKTCAEFRAETALTVKRQRRIRSRLVECGVLEMKRTGFPAMPSYRVNIDKLNAMIKTYTAQIAMGTAARP